MNGRKSRKLFKWLIGAAVGAGVVMSAAGIGFVAAYVIEYHRGPAVTFADRVGQGLARRWKEAFLPDSFAAETEETLRFSSIFVPLRGEVVRIPSPDRPGKGGAVTSWDDRVVLMTHEGAIHLIGADNAVARARIEAPFNGFDDYVAAAARPPFNEYGHDFKLFRYNDIAAFEVDGRRGLLASYTRFHADGNCFTTAVSRLWVEAGEAGIADRRASATDWQDLFETRPCLPMIEGHLALEGHMAGGRMVFDGARTVYLASGDYAWDGLAGPRAVPGADPAVSPAVAQDPAADYGKVIAIDVLSGQARQISRGQRNMQGIALDRAGRVWTVEHGPRGGDELNLVVEGRDYGWPSVSYGVLYAGLPLPGTENPGRHDGFQRPMLAWLPSIAVSGLARVENFDPAWDGDLLATTLAGQRLVRIRIAEDRVIFAEEIETGRRMRDVHQHTDGRLVIWTDEEEIIFLSPAAGGLSMDYVEGYLATIEGGLARQVRAALERCMQCHSLAPWDHAGGPSLADVFDAPVGATAFSGYSDAFRRDDRVWTRDLLADYLRDPAATVPGTKMPDPRVEDERVIHELINILERLATDA